MNYENIPDELKSLPQWCCFRAQQGDNGKYKKVIISPVTGKFVKCNAPETWADFQTAKAYCNRYKFDGLTFALTGGVVFIDIDHAIDKDSGKILSEEAKQLMQLFPDTYIEKSVSGSGLHLLIAGHLPQDALNRNDKKGLEMYETNRFICMTGDLLSSVKTIKDCSAIIAKINYEFIGKRQEAVITTLPPIDWKPSDTELIKRITDSKSGSQFLELYSGGFGSNQDHSSADFALVSRLAWWTQDTTQIDRIFRSSGLYRPKWDSRRGSSTYGKNLIDTVMSRLTNCYTPKPKMPSIKYTTQSEM